MARRTSDRIYGASGHPMIEALPLLLAFLVGTIGGIILKVSGVAPLISAGFAAAILCSYALVAYVATPLRMDSETIGDNSYYLGFLFTLTSLAVTLYFVIKAAPTDSAALIPEIISGFGVALSSTIVGVFLRVLLMQLKVDVESRERRARLELDESARRFRTELGISLDKVKRFSTESLQQASEREDRMRIACDNLMADMQLELLKSAADFGPALRDSIKAQTQAAFAEIAAAVSEVSQQATVQIREAMTNMTLVARDAAERNREVAATMGEDFARLRSAAELLVDSAELTTARLMAAERKARELSNSMSQRWETDAAQVTSALSSVQTRLAGDTGDYLDAAARAGQSIDEAARKFQQTLQISTKTFVDASHTSGAELEAAATKMQGVIDAATETVARKIQTVQG